MKPLFALAACLWSFVAAPSLRGAGDQDKAPDAAADSKDGNPTPKKEGTRRTGLKLPMPPMPKPGKVGDTTVLFSQSGPMFPAHGGPAVKLASLAGQGVILFGGIGSLVIGEHWGVGVGSYSMSSEYSNFILGVQNDISFSYGGLLVDTTWGERELIYYNFSTLLGYGGGTATPRKPGEPRGRSSFGVVEPEIKININLTTDIRIALGASYRFTAGADNGAILGVGLDGPSMVIEFLVGKILRQK